MFVCLLVRLVDLGGTPRAAVEVALPSSILVAIIVGLTTNTALLKRLEFYFHSLCRSLSLPFQCWRPKVPRESFRWFGTRLLFHEAAFRKEMQTGPDRALQESFSRVLLLPEQKNSFSSSPTQPARQAPFSLGSGSEWVGTQAGMVGFLLSLQSCAGCFYLAAAASELAPKALPSPHCSGVGIHRHRAGVPP